MEKSVHVGATGRGKLAMGVGVVLILLVLFYKYIGLLFGGAVPHPVLSEKRIIYAMLIWWGMVGFVYLYSRYVEVGPLLRGPAVRNTIGFYILSILGITVVVFFLMVVGSLVLKAMGFEVIAGGEVLERLVGIYKQHMWLLLLTAVTAGVTEELIFRGYIQGRLEIISGSPVTGILLSALLFSVAHLGYGTAKELLLALVIGTVYSLHYHFYRNIYVLMLAHFLFDLFQLLVLVNR